MNYIPQLRNQQHLSTDVAVTDRSKARLTLHISKSPQLRARDTTKIKGELKVNKVNATEISNSKHGHGWVLRKFILMLLPVCENNTNNTGLLTT
jgi:hypothetical protein